MNEATADQNLPALISDDELEARHPGAAPLDDLAREQFAHDCLIMSQSEAYRRAFPVCVMNRWLPSTVHVEASKLCAEPKVGQRVDYLRRSYAARYGAGANRVVAELAAIGMSDLADVMRIEGGKLYITDFSRLNPAQRRAIKKVRVVRIGKDGEGSPIEAVEIELHDKVRALELLGRHHLLFDGAGNLGQRVLRITMDLGGGRPEERAIIDVVAEERPVGTHSAQLAGESNKND